MNQPTTCPYPTWVEVDLAAVAHNTRALLQAVNVPVMAVVKANAYGHGMLPVAKTALASGAEWLGVARFGEARQLRQAGISTPILVFGMATAAEVDEAIAEQVTLTLHSFQSAELFAARADEMRRTLNVHLKIDTGMGRLGVMPEEGARLAQYASGFGGIKVNGIYSHLSMVDDSPNHPLTALQLERFNCAVEALQSAGIAPRWVHLSNSAACYGLPEARFNLVRAGSAIVGLRPFYYSDFPESMRRSLSWKAQLASCKLLPKGWGIGYGVEHVADGKTWVGVVPVGYGDGFRRQPGNVVLINGQRVPVIGRVCIDQCMVALPEALPVGSEVVLIGKQGSEAIYAEELVRRWASSEAGVVAMIDQRVPRVYHSSSD